jgi:cysteine desulfurase
LEVFKEVERRGGEVTVLPVDEYGLLSLQDLKQSLKKNTVLVSVSYANNEIGTIQPIHSIARIIKDFRLKNNTVFPYLHTDACQAGLYLSLDVLKLGIDMMTLDGIKIYGPRGSGILYVKNNVEMDPVFFGGGQERGLRSGTENVANISGLSLAFEIANKMRDKETLRLGKIQDYAIDKILNLFPKSSLNGSRKYRLPNNVNICFDGLDVEFAVISLDVAGISASYSSSCRTLKEDSSSYVVESLGKEGCGKSSLRFTFGRETKKSDIDFLITSLKRIML